jgi:hypothetical protein
MSKLTTLCMTLALCLPCSGCFAHTVGMGSRFSAQQTNQLQLGMTKDQVITIMGGQPTSVESTVDAQAPLLYEELGWVDLGVFTYKSVSTIFVDQKLVEICTGAAGGRCVSAVKARFGAAYGPYGDRSATGTTTTTKTGMFGGVPTTSTP